MILMTKRRLLVSGVFLLLAVSLSAAVFLIPGTRAAEFEPFEAVPAGADGSDTMPAPSFAPDSPGGGAEEEEAPEAFVLRDLDGYVAVYRLPEIERPDMVTGIDTRVLRRADYLALQTGIRVEGWENLQSALEDFGP